MDPLAEAGAVAVREEHWSGPAVVAPTSPGTALFEHDHAKLDRMPEKTSIVSSNGGHAQMWEAGGRYFDLQ